MGAAQEATLRRILAEGRREFAGHGLAGARMQRVAVRAGVTREELGLRFAGKEELFTAVCEDIVNATADEARFSADDVPGYVGRLFDVYAVDPDIGRLHDRIVLDGARDVPRLRERTAKLYAAKVAELRRGQRTGVISAEWAPATLLAMLIGAARLMAQQHPLALGTERGDAVDHTLQDRRRAAVRAAERLIRPAPDGSGAAVTPSAAGAPRRR